MLGIRCPDRHALSRTTPSIIRRPRCVLAPARAGSFIGAKASSDAQPQIIGSPPKAAVAGSPVTNRRSEPVSVVAAGLCQCRVALPPRFCIGTLTFGDHPVLFRGRVSPPARAISRIGSPQIRRWAVVRPFSTFLGRETKTVPIGEQSGMPGSLPQCMVQNTRSQCTDCLRQPDRRPPGVRTCYKSHRAQDRFRR
jgi:hypothetical protein